MNPRYPIYIPSKGRWESRMTVRALDRLGVPYRVIVEEQEHAAYAAVIDPARLLVLDPEYQEHYDACDEFGMTRSKGSGPARNFAWEHSVAEGHASHWIVDDNIREFYRFHENRLIRVGDATVFVAMEKFVDRYANVAMAGPHYFMFVKRKNRHREPYVLNSRIFSCNLIRNDVPFRWRARYNEDVDLSLRMLKAGYCTILFKAFLQGKVSTQTMKGGNTDELYAEGTREKSEMLARLHPDVARVAWRFGRVHHYVDYSPFVENQLIRRRDVEPLVTDSPYEMYITDRVAHAQ